ncbi:MAG: helix-turn-helix domain-containing protein [Akkermansia sp.]
MRTGRPKVNICVTEQEEVLLCQALLNKDAKKRDKARLILTARNRALSISGLAQLLGRSTKTIQRWFTKWKQGSYQSLMKDARGPGKQPQVNPELQKELRSKLEEGVMNVAEVQQWLHEKGISLSYRGTHYWMKKLGRS